jgi:DNA processing protein
MFPARNRLMAALAGITVVIEAAERSGSLITAEMALEGGRLVGAVPGPVNSWRSSGTNRLLADGAAVVRHAQDVLDLLLGPGQSSAREIGPPLTLDEEAILAVVEGGARGADAVCRGTGLGYPVALAGLGRLERAGYVSSDATGSYARTAMVPPEPGSERGAASTIGA